MRRKRKEVGWAEIFAADLIRGCQDLYAVFGGETLVLPVSIPIAEDGLVLLQPQGPLDAPRVPARLTVTRPTPGTYRMHIQRVDGGTLRIPDLDGAEPLAALDVVITPTGLVIDDLSFTEPTARALANALLITIGMKLIKARRNG